MEETVTYKEAIQHIKNKLERTINNLNILMERIDNNFEAHEKRISELETDNNIYYEGKAILKLSNKK